RWASVPPVAIDSSSGWAWTSRTVGSIRRSAVSSGSRADSGVLLAQAGRGLRPLLLVEDHLADAHGRRRHLDALVLIRELQALLQGERARWHEVLEGVRRGRTHVRELLLLRDVHV